MAKLDPRVDMLLRVIDQSYGARGWHGTTLRRSLRGVSVETARWRPAADRHCIWELVLHTAYWKYIVRRRLSGDRSLKFPRQGSNWLPVSAAGDAGQWRRDVTLLEREHELLRRVVAGLPANRLNRRVAGSGWTYDETIWGIAAHDAYHTGQIQLLKKVRGEK